MYIFIILKDLVDNLVIWLLEIPSHKLLALNWNPWSQLQTYDPGVSVQPAFGPHMLGFSVHSSMFSVQFSFLHPALHSHAPVILSHFTELFLSHVHALAQFWPNVVLEHSERCRRTHCVSNCITCTIMQFTCVSREDDGDKQWSSHNFHKHY
jgi:hypothetical protein